MSYLVCDDCGGYYELQEGESADDFENCQCGGHLKFLEKPVKPLEKKARFVCSNCLEENKPGLYCSKCGGRLISINNKNTENKSGISYDNDHIERLARNSKNASRDYKRNQRPNNSNNIKINSSKIIENIFNRINWPGVITGLGFFLIIGVILILMLAYSLHDPYNLYNFIIPSSYEFGFLFSILSGLAIISGALSAIISKKTKYVDGLIQGFMVGFSSSIIIGYYSGEFFATLVAIIIFGGLAAVGGLVGIFIRNQLLSKQ
jgi:hypothetical protein